MKRLMKKTFQKNKVSGFYLLLFLLLISGCNKQFLGFKFKPRNTLTIEEIDFQYLSTRAKIKYKSPNEKSKATANIRIKKDSLIWFTLSNGVGIEGARGKITQDSVILMDRINKKVFSYSMESLSEELKFNLNFELFQSVIIGDMPIATSKSDDIVEKNNNFFVTQIVGDMRISSLITAKNRRLENLLASTTKNSNTLELKYSDFQPLKNKPFAFKALMTIIAIEEGKKLETTIDIEHKRVVIEEELPFPFVIPPRYENQ